MFSASLSQVNTANSWLKYSKCAPSSQHQENQFDCSDIPFLINGWYDANETSKTFFLSLSLKNHSTGAVSIVVFPVLFIYISSIFENAASFCAWFCFLLRNQTVSGSPSLIFPLIMNCVKRTYLFCIDKVWLQHEEILALFCFLSSFISKLTKAYRNQIKWLTSSHAVSSSFWIESQEDTCGSQPSSVTSRPHCLPNAQCNEFSLNIKLQLWQCSTSSLGSHICCNVNFPEEFLIVVSTVCPIDCAHHSGAQYIQRWFQGPLWLGCQFSC